MFNFFKKEIIGVDSKQQYIEDQAELIAITETYDKVRTIDQNILDRELKLRKRINIYLYKFEE